MKYNLLIVLLVTCFVLQSQTKLKVQVTDKQKNPIAFAIIKYQSSTLSTNETGFLKIDHCKAGAKLSVYKFGFADTSFMISDFDIKRDSLQITITLRLKPTLLPEVSVSASLIEEINPMKADFILDYELKDDYLLQLLSDDIVLVRNAENKITYNSRPLSGASSIQKDPYGKTYIVTDKSACLFHAENNSYNIDKTPVDFEKLNWNLNYCDAAVDNSLFIRRYKDNNQTIAFFATSATNTQSTRLLKEIGNADRKNAVNAFANETAAFNAYLASRGLSHVTATTEDEMKLVNTVQKMNDFLEINYVLPTYSVLRLVNDSVYLFAHDIDSMFVYDKSWDLVKTQRIQYHHLKIWDKELIVNEEKTKVYAKLLENSKTQIVEIDLQTGLLKSRSVTLEARFPKKIKIRNNQIYFLAKQKRGTGYTLYTQKLQ